MPKIQTRCPNCQQPIVAEIQQVIDGGRNPQHKELILSGGLNIAQCQACGFQGQLPVPMVYHDAEKEILYTFSPPDVSKTMEEKEGALAPLLKNIIDSLEKKRTKRIFISAKSHVINEQPDKEHTLGRWHYRRDDRKPAGKSEIAGRFICSRWGSIDKNN